MHYVIIIKTVFINLILYFVGPELAELGFEEFHVTVGLHSRESDHQLEHLGYGEAKDVHVDLLAVHAEVVF